MNQEQVVLVDQDDQELGLMEKMEAHEKGLLHRAFSVFIFDEEGRVLLQQRALSKYHSGGLWTNACCSHPREGESVDAAAHRRLQEEMGFDCELRKEFHFIYRAELDQGLTEHELDHVLTGTYSDTIFPNEEEVMAYRYISMADIEAELEKDDSQFTEWFKIALPALREQLGI